MFASFITCHNVGPAHVKHSLSLFSFSVQQIVSVSQCIMDFSVYFGFIALSPVGNYRYDSFDERARLALASALRLLLLCMSSIEQSDMCLVHC